MFYLGLIFLKIIGYLLSFFPRKIFIALGKTLGTLLLKVKFRKDVALGNLQIAFPFLDQSQRERFLVDSYKEMGILFLELLGSFFGFRKFVSDQCDIEGIENLKKAQEEGKGVFVFSAHLGNWEVLAAAGPILFNTPATMVTKELKPRWFQRAVSLTRELYGVKMALEPRTMMPIKRALKNNQIVGFMMDQFAGAPVGARVPFFGKPVGSHIALATLAIRTGAPVVPAIAVRKPNGRYLLRLDRPISTIFHEDFKQAVILNTAQYVSHTEGWIKEFPLQWMWIHRRWKGNLSPLRPGEVGEMLD